MRKKEFTTVDITTPKDGWQVRENYYWVCENGDPTKALFFSGNAPQCNRNEKLSTWIIDRGIYKNYHAPISVVFVAVAYTPERG